MDRASAEPFLGKGGGFLLGGGSLRIGLFGGGILPVPP